MKDIAISGAHDAAALGEKLRTDGWVQIPGFLPDQMAEELYGLLRANPTWYLTYNEGDSHFEVPQATMNQLPPAQKQNFWRNLHLRARDSFQYVFLQYYITAAIERGEHPGHPLHFMQDFVNSAPFLDFMRTVTGEDAITRSDCFASMYGPGHFLTNHDDTHKKEDRVAAFVLSMTKTWRADWGGSLVFYDDDMNIRHGFTPAFNTLNLFLVPQPHAVTHVAPFAGDLRTSFLGWLKR